MLCHYAESHCAECRIVFISMLNDIMLNVVMLSIVALWYWWPSNSGLSTKNKLERLSLAILD